MCGRGISEGEGGREGGRERLVQKEGRVSGTGSLADACRYTWATRLQLHYLITPHGMSTGRERM